MTKNFDASEIKNLRSETWMQEVEGILLFLGHAHSGHSIIGAMIDSHPEAAIANEINILKSIRDHKLTKDQILNILYKESLGDNKTKEWLNSEYEYTFLQTQQGLTTHPKILGDKKAGGTTRIICNSEWTLDHLLHLFGTKVKFIYVERNPIDIVSAYAYYMKQRPSQFHVDRYIENRLTSLKVKKLVNSEQWLHIKQNNFVHKPEENLTRIFNFLDLSNDNKLNKHLSSYVKSNIKSKSSIISLPENLKNQLTPYL